MIVRHTDPSEHVRKHGASVRAWLERVAASTREVFRAPAPRKRCDVCNGSGVESWIGSHAGSCSGCNGFCSVPLNESELRAAYRAARRLACERLLTTPAAFDAAIAKALPAGAGALQWAQAARAIVAKTSGREKSTEGRKKVFDERGEWFITNS